MPAITASMVAELRAKTDAPMMECKKALTEADGDLARAEEILRVKLGNKAGKAASRVTAEGVVAAHVAGSTGAMVENVSAISGGPDSITTSRASPLPPRTARNCRAASLIRSGSSAPMRPLLSRCGASVHSGH